MRAFISYSVAEKEFGGAVKRALESLGVECFLAHEDIQVSEEWKARILQELREVDIFVTLLSAKFKASDWCSQELGFIASRPEVVIVPLRIDGTNPYGLISHLQGQYVSDESSIPGIIEDLLYRKRPRDMIPIQIERVRSAGGFRVAEAAVRPLVPHFNIFTEKEVADFTSAAVGNYEVWDAGLCRSDYLPKFVAVNGKRIPDALKRALKEKVENLDMPETSA
jgi:hypothetical protein